MPLNSNIFYVLIIYNIYTDVVMMGFFNETSWQSKVYRGVFNLVTVLCTYQVFHHREVKRVKQLSLTNPHSHNQHKWNTTNVKA